jgi:uncharacterized protein YsxB (DUF464 family)
MIRVKHYNDGMTIEGHAGYAEAGQDIVCAGVSAIVQTLIQSVEDLTAELIEYTMQPGFVEVRFLTLSDEGRVLLDSALIGLQMIAEAHPHHVAIEK